MGSLSYKRRVNGKWLLCSPQLLSYFIHGVEGRAFNRALLNPLNARERDIIERLYGLNGDPEIYDDIAASYRVTRERIRQIESKAIRRMRHPKAMRMRPKQ